MAAFALSFFVSAIQSKLRISRMIKAGLFPVLSIVARVAPLAALPFVHVLQ